MRRWQNYDKLHDNPRFFHNFIRKLSKENKHNPTTTGSEAFNLRFHNVLVLVRANESLVVVVYCRGTSKVKVEIAGIIVSVIGKAIKRFPIVLCASHCFKPGHLFLRQKPSVMYPRHEFLTIIRTGSFCFGQKWWLLKTELRVFTVGKDLESWKIYNFFLIKSWEKFQQNEVESHKKQPMSYNLIYNFWGNLSFDGCSVFRLYFFEGSLTGVKNQSFKIFFCFERDLNGIGSPDTAKSSSLAPFALLKQQSSFSQLNRNYFLFPGLKVGKTNTFLRKKHF